MCINHTKPHSKHSWLVQTPAPKHRGHSLTILYRCLGNNEPAQEQVTFSVTLFMTANNENFNYQLCREKNLCVFNIIQNFIHI